jgi:hypothetical protein
MCKSQVHFLVRVVANVIDTSDYLHFTEGIGLQSNFLRSPV